MIVEDAAILIDPDMRLDVIVSADLQDLPVLR